MGAVLHDTRVFFEHLADVGWTSLAIALACQFVKLCCVSRAWRNILSASYPQAKIRWRSIFGAMLARVGVNAIVPARGGDAVGLFIAKRRVEGSTYPTLGATLIALTLFDSVVALSFSVGMRVTLIVFNALLGFGSILVMLRTLHWRQRVESDRGAVAEQ